MRNSKNCLTVLVSVVVCVMAVYSPVCSEDIKAERKLSISSALSAPSSSVGWSVTSISPSSPVSGHEIKARRPTITGSLYTLTALSAKELSLLAAGEVLIIGQLNRNAQRQILSGAAQALGEEVYPRMVGDIPSAAIRGLSVTPRMALFVEGGGLGDGKVEETKFSIIAPSLRPSESAFVQALPGESLKASSVLSYRDTWSAAATDSTYALKPAENRLVLPKMADPPSIRAIMSGAPKDADDAALTAYLWARADDLLSPMGDYYLQCAGAPFSIRDFGDSRVMSVRSLPDRVSDWLRPLYERRREDMELLPIEKESFLAKYHEPIPDDARFTVTKDGRTMSAKWSDIGDIVLPAWESLGDAHVRLSVSYSLIVHVLKPVTDEEARALTAKGNVTTEGTKIWIDTGHPPVAFAPGACPPVYVLSPGKGCGWAFQ